MSIAQKPIIFHDLQEKSGENLRALMAKHLRPNPMIADRSIAKNKNEGFYVGVFINLRDILI